MLSESNSSSARSFTIEAREPDRSGRAVRDRVSSEEWQARLELAALYRLVSHFKWTDTIYNHISMRVPGEFSFLINPFGLLYDEVTASSLVKVDVNGVVLDDPTGLGVNQAGFVIHGAIHAARHDVVCVLHTHTKAGAAVAAQVHGLLPISQYAAALTGKIAYHEFEGIAVNDEEQKRIVADLGNRYLMILRNHGLLTAGRSAGETLFYMHWLERACEVQVAALSGGAPVQSVSAESAAVSTAILDSVNGNYNRLGGDAPTFRPHCSRLR